MQCNPVKTLSLLAVNTSYRQMPLFNVRLSAEQMADLASIAISYGITKTGLVELWIARGRRRFVKTERKDTTRRSTSLEVVQVQEEKKETPSSTKYRGSPDARRITALLIDLMRENKPDMKPVPESSVPKWEHCADLMHSRDERSWEDIGRVLRWTQGHSFWRRNIRSMPKLREQYDRLDMEAKETPNGKNGNGRKTVAASEPLLPGMSTGNPEASARDWLELHATCPGCQQCTEAKTVLSRHLLAEGK